MWGNINKFPDISIVSGAFTPLAFICRDDNRNPIPLSTATNFGCTFASIDDGDTSLFNIIGVIDQSKANENVMLINLSSSLTEDLGDYILYYYPYIVLNGETIRPGRGKITIVKAPAVN